MGFVASPPLVNSCRHIRHKCCRQWHVRYMSHGLQQGLCCSPGCIEEQCNVSRAFTAPIWDGFGDGFGDDSFSSAEGVEGGRDNSTYVVSCLRPISGRRGLLDCSRFSGLITSTLKTLRIMVVCRTCTVWYEYNWSDGNEDDNGSSTRAVCNFPWFISFQIRGAFCFIMTVVASKGEINWSSKMFSLDRLVPVLLRFPFCTLSHRKMFLEGIETIALGALDLFLLQVKRSFSQMKRHRSIWSRFK